MGLEHKQQSGVDTDGSAGLFRDVCSVVHFWTQPASAGAAVVLPLRTALFPA